MPNLSHPKLDMNSMINTAAVSKTPTGSNSVVSREAAAQLVGLQAIQTCLEQIQHVYEKGLQLVARMEQADDPVRELTMLQRLNELISGVEASSKALQQVSWPDSATGTEPVWRDLVTLRDQAAQCANELITRVDRMLEARQTKMDELVPLIDEEFNRRRMAAAYGAHGGPHLPLATRRGERS
jgi:hypothetical protein